MIKKISFFLCMFLITAISTFAQSVSDIKNGNTYYYGEGSGDDMESAEQAAMEALSRSIVVHITVESKQELSSQNVNGNIKEKDMFEQSSNFISNVTLQNVQRKILKDDGSTVEVLCYVEKSEVEKMEQTRIAKIKDMVSAGKIAEKNLQIDDALRYYYWAYLFSLYSKPADVEFGDYEGKAAEILPIKLKQVIQTIKACVSDGEEAPNNGVNARVEFTYNDQPVSTVTFTYLDGEGRVGPISARNGLAEVELTAAAVAKKSFDIIYEYKFASEAASYDPEINSLVRSQKKNLIDSRVPLAIKVAKGSVAKQKPVQAPATMTMGAGESQKTASAAVITAEPTKIRETIPMKAVDNPQPYLDAIAKVENAIKAGNPSSVQGQFTEVGYMLFSKVMESGKASLLGRQDHQVITDDDGNITGRFTTMKIKHKNGKTFTENLVYRFEPDGKIKSVAFALNRKAEEDIMNASSSWPEVSRHIIQRFMEDYQTAFALKRTDYISSIFSDDAIIIVGSILKKASAEEVSQDFKFKSELDNSNPKVKYEKYSKAEYIKKLEQTFKQSDYVHLTFEDNQTKIMDTKGLAKKGACFAIQIRQRYDSPYYSDEGYLSLILDTRGEVPIILVRLWQPNVTDMVKLNAFMKEFDFQ